MTKIDWTKPLELSDGTPVVRTSNGSPNPDSHGDYFVSREDGLPFLPEQNTHLEKVFIARPDGSAWGRHIDTPMTVRNRKAPSAPRQFAIGDRVDIVGKSSARYPGTVKGVSSSVVMVQADSDRDAGLDLMSSFFRETGEATGSVKVLRLDMTPVRTVYYRTFGRVSPNKDIVGVMHCRTLDEARRLGSANSLGVLKFTEEDGKIVNIEVVHVA